MKTIEIFVVGAMLLGSACVIVDDNGADDDSQADDTESEPDDGGGVDAAGNDAPSADDDEGGDTDDGDGTDDGDDTDADDSDSGNDGAEGGTDGGTQDDGGADDAQTGDSDTGAQAGDGDTTDGDTTGDDGDAVDVFFDADVLPIIQENCGCHRSGSPSAGLNMTDAAAYNSLVGQPSSNGLNYVTPGDPEQSYMAHKIQGTHVAAGGAGSMMPLGGDLSNADVATIVEWISDGAQ